MGDHKLIIDFINASTTKIGRRRRKQLVNLAILDATKFLDFRPNPLMRKAINRSFRFACFSKQDIDKYNELKDDFTATLLKKGYFNAPCFNRDIALWTYNGTLICFENYEKEKKIKGQYFTKTVWDVMAADYV